MKTTKTQQNTTKTPRLLKKWLCFFGDADMSAFGVFWPLSCNICFNNFFQPFTTPAVIVRINTGLQERCFKVSHFMETQKHQIRQFGCLIINCYFPTAKFLCVCDGVFCQVKLALSRASLCHITIYWKWKGWKTSCALHSMLNSWKMFSKSTFQDHSILYIK